MADVRIGAIGRVKTVAGFNELLKFGSQGREFALPFPDLDELAVKKKGNMRAWGLTGIPMAKDIRGFGQCETGGLGCTDKPQPSDDRLVIASIPVGFTAGRRKESLPLVEPDGLPVYAGNAGYFPDEHRPSLTLDLIQHCKVYREDMEITLQYFEDCPNWKIADERLTILAGERPDITVTRQIIDAVEEAERAKFHGSPSILINGVDVFANASAPVGLACRRYLTGDGPAGSPTLEQLRAAAG